jgi:DNA-binding transcriptional ArsR family regulator
MGKQDEGGEVDQQIVRALAHPLRIEILRVLEKGPSSPSRIAEVLMERLGNVSYHVTVLLSCDCIELFDTKPVRGAVEHLYKVKPQGALGSRTWQEVPPSLRTSSAGNALAGFTSRAIEALEAGTVESREGSGLSWLPLIVDEAGWKELRRILDGFEERFHAVAEKSAKRLENPQDGTPVIVAIAAFETEGKKDSGS